MSLGKRLQSIRKQKGLSQEQLAAKLNISRQALSKWESDINVPSVDKIIDVAKALDVSVNELLGIEETTNSEYGQLKSILNQVVLTQNNEIKRNKRSLLCGVIIGALVIIILSVLLGKIIKDINDNVTAININVSNQLATIDDQILSLQDSISTQLQEQLLAQDSLLSSFDLNVEKIDFDNKLMQVKINSVVRNYDDHSQMSAILDFDNHDSQTIIFNLNEGHFIADEMLPIDNIRNATIVVENETKQSQLLKNVAIDILDSLKLPDVAGFEFRYVEDEIECGYDLNHNSGDYQEEQNDDELLGEDKKFAKWQKENKIVASSVTYYINDQKKTAKTKISDNKISWKLATKSIKDKDIVKIVLNYEDRLAIKYHEEYTYRCIDYGYGVNGINLSEIDN